MTKIAVLITGIVWASLLLISWGGAVDIPETSAGAEKTQTADL
jgi:hypothetical protein